ncbi:MAG: aminoglycoside phosphotransferase family protein [Acidobacteria bacterium]|nr:aminoglycoside phosphotransferase family protein [Acidobacteriota bacterium]
MIPGAPAEARWTRAAPRRAWPRPVLERMLHAAFPRGRLVEVQPLAGGRRNANFKLRLDSMSEPVVLRIYEHDASLCQKEIDLLGLVAGSVPVPKVIHAATRGLEELPPFALMRFVEGISFRELRRTGDADAIAHTAPLLEGADPMPRFVDSCLASENLQRRLPADLRDRIHAVLWASSAALAAVSEERRLVHGDFNKRNLLVRPEAGRIGGTSQN